MGVFKKLTVAAVIACLLYAGLTQTIYMHTHVGPDGSTVVHSHPYKSSPDDSGIPTHNHTRNELFLLGAISHIGFTLLTYFAVVCSILLFSKYLFRKTAKEKLNSFLFAESMRLRAPPTFC